MKENSYHRLHQSIETADGVKITNILLPENEDALKMFIGDLVHSMYRKQDKDKVTATEIIITAGWNQRQDDSFVRIDMTFQ